MATMRHWKQRWDPNAKLVFIRRLNLGVEGCKVALPGQPVTPEIEAALGKHAKGRLKRWFEAGYLGLADWKSQDEIRREREAEAAPMTSGGPEPISMGRGWYMIQLPDGTHEKVRGKDNAQARIVAAWEPKPVPNVLKVNAKALRAALTGA